MDVPGEVLQNYSNNPELCSVSSLGCGNINDTFLVEYSGTSFVLQRINSTVFPEPIRVIQNFSQVFRHLLSAKRECCEQFSMAEPIVTLRGKLFCRDPQGEYWRAQSYIPHTVVVTMSEKSQAYQVGRALATFHKLIGDLDDTCLQDPLPGFHDLPRYLEEFDTITGTINDFAAEEMCYCLAVIAAYRETCTLLEEARNSGILVFQPIHGDPKVDNFLFDKKGFASGMLDFDTVGMGLIHHDIGDCLRSCCNRSGEVGESSSRTVFDMSLCKSLLKGYFSRSHSLFTDRQRLLIFDGVLQITFELGLRFFTDHLHGDRYFKVRYHGENLIRAVNQFQLADDVKRYEKKIKALLV